MKFRKIWVAPAMVAVGALAFAGGFGMGRNIDSAQAGEASKAGVQLADKDRPGSRKRPKGPRFGGGGLTKAVCISGFKSQPSPPYAPSVDLYTCRSRVVKCVADPYTTLNNAKFDGTRFSYVCAKHTGPK